MTSHESPRPADRSAASAPVPTFVESALSGLRYRVYLAEPDESMTPVHASGIDLDLLESWDMELTTSRPWLVAGASILALSELGESIHLTPPANDLRLMPLLDGDVLLGGFLLEFEGEDPQSYIRDHVDAPRLRDYGMLLLAYLGERREAEQLRAFRAAVSAVLPFGFLAIDSLGRVTEFGGKAEMILDVSSTDAIGRDCARVFRPVGLERNPLLEGLTKPLGPLELFISRPNGGEVPISLQLFQHQDEQGNPGLVAFFSDLSEERSLEEAERHKDRLAVLGELSAGVAHEIRNPLTGIANCAQVLLEDSSGGAKGERFLKIILDEVARLNRIVEGLLGYARPNSPQLRESDLEECLKRAIELCSIELEEHGVRTDLRIRGRIPKIYFDSNQVEQVLLNLVRNAGQAMPRGGDLRIQASVIRRLPHRRRGTGRRSTDRVRLVQEAPRQRFVQIQITDTGTGIPKDIQSRIWNPFFTTKTKGTGLGLSLSASIVREHGGFLDIRSVENKGTTVLLDLPIERRQGERRKNS